MLCKEKINSDTHQSSKLMINNYKRTILLYEWSIVFILLLIPGIYKRLSMLVCNNQVLLSHTKACKHRSEIDNGKPTQ